MLRAVTVGRGCCRVVGAQLDGVIVRWWWEGGGGLNSVCEGVAEGVGAAAPGGGGGVSVAKCTFFGYLFFGLPVVLRERCDVGWGWVQYCTR